MKWPKTIWLIDIGDEMVWCDCPDPEDGVESCDVAGPYVLQIDDDSDKE